MTMWLRVPIGHRLSVVLTAAGLISCSAGSGAGGIKPVSAAFAGSSQDSDLEAGGKGSGRVKKGGKDASGDVGGNSLLTGGGAVGNEAPPADAAVPEPSAVEQLIATDAASHGGGSVVYARIDHLSPDKSQSSELNMVRYGMVKVLNSVSTAPTIVRPVAIDPGKTVYRIDFNEFAQPGAVARLGGAPYAQENLSRIGSATVVKGDWLVYVLSRPEVYDYLLRLPQLGTMLDATLRVDYNQAKYVNTDRSDVTFNGRVLMRMPIENGGKPGGYYWRSYDFGRSDVQQRGFNDPRSLRTTSIPDLVAGEIIYSLPNGMQAYYLVGFGNQHRFDVPAGSGIGSLPVASDMRRPQDGLTHCVGGKAACGFVINGESCMSCHSAGVNAPTNPVGTTGATLAEMNEYIKQDRARFTGALSEMGFPEVSDEPILATCRLFLSDRGISDKRQQASEVPGLIGR